MEFLNLSWMRQNSGSMFVFLIFGILIIVFALQFGPGSSGFTATSHEAGSINGQAVTIGELSFYYNQLYEQKQRMDAGYNKEKADADGLVGQAFDQIADKVLLAQTGDDFGFQVSDMEVGKDIVNSPSFQVEGRFDKEYYKRVVQYYYKMSIGRYEEKRKGEMAGERILSLLRDGAVVSDQAAFVDWKLSNEKVNLQFVKFPFKSFLQAEAEPTEADINALLQSGTEGDAKIKAYYDDHKAEYVKEEQVRARHILLKVAKDTPEADVEKVKKEIDKLYEQLKAAPDTFADVAKEKSEDSSKTKGGDLGFFSRKRMVKEFEEVAFSLNEGEIGAPVRTQFGWHIIKVEEKKAAEERPVTDDAVRKEIAAKVIKRERALAKAMEPAKKLLADLKTGKTLDELVPAPKEGETAKPDAPKVEETGSFAKNSVNYVARIGKSEEVMSLAWDKLTPEKPLAEEPVVVSDDVYVIRLKERKIPTLEEFQDKKEWPLRSFKSQLASASYEGWLEKQKEDASIRFDHAVNLVDKDTF